MQPSIEILDLRYFHSVHFNQKTIK